MVASTALLVASIASTAAATGAQLYAQKQAGKAADNEAKYKEALLQRKATDQRNMVSENSRTRLLERQRTLSELRVRMAERGFANSGTQLAVFGEFGSRLDDSIDEATTQGLGQVQAYNENIRMSKWMGESRRSAAKIDTFTTLAKGTTQLGSSLYTNYRETGNSFGIFKNP